MLTKLIWTALDKCTLGKEVLLNRQSHGRSSASWNQKQVLLCVHHSVTSCWTWSQITCRLLSYLFKYIYINVISANWNNKIRKDIIFKKKKKKKSPSSSAIHLHPLEVGSSVGGSIFKKLCKIFWNKFIPSAVLYWGQFSFSLQV